MKKSSSLSVIITAVTLALSLTLAGCGGGSGSASGGDQPGSGPSEESIVALDGTWVNDEGYGIRLDGSSSTYVLKTPSGRVGDSNYYAADGPDHYGIYFNQSEYDLVPGDDGSLRIVPTEPPEEGTEALKELVFTKDESVYFGFDLTGLDGTWKADGASLTLDTNAKEYRLSSEMTTAEGTIDNDWDGRGWFLSWSYYDEETAEVINDPAFLILDDEERLHLEAKDPSLAPYTFVQEGTGADLPGEGSASMIQARIESAGSWIDDAGNGLMFKADKGKYILETANGRNGSGSLRFNSERGTYELSFNGADYALSLAEDDFDVLYLTLIGGTPAGNGETLDKKPFIYDMFTTEYENPASFYHGSWADDAGFTLNINSLHEEEVPRFDYVSPKGSEEGILGNDEDGMGWYIPWNDSDGKACLIVDGYDSNKNITFETDDPALAAVKLVIKGD